MMKKISKLLAVVLAVAMLICPAMCLTSMAETSTDAYTLNYADGVLTVNVAPGEDFLVSLIKIDIEGYVVDEDNIAVTTEEGVSFSANPSYENGVLTLLLASKEAANVHLVSSATVTIPATKDESASKYYIALTNIQVATTGTADAPDSFIAIDGVNADGAVANVVPVVNETAGPAVDPALVFYRTSLAYGTSSLEFNFRIATTVLDLYSNVEVVIIPQKYDMTTLNLVEDPEEFVIAKKDLAAAGSKYKQYTYKDIQLYELGLNIDYMLRAYDAEGNLVATSETFNTSIAKLLAENAADTTKSAAYRTLCVDTLIVCDEVMKNVAKSYTTSDLAEAVAAGSVLDGVDTSIATQTIKACNTVNNFVSHDSNYLQSTSTHQIRSSVAIGKVPYINFRVKDQKNALDLNKLEVRVQYTSKDSAGEHPYDKTFSGANLTDGTFINCTFDEVGFHDSDKDILFTVYYDGAKKCEWTYSIETYLDGLKDSSTTGAQMTALIKLGQSFRTYQGL